MCPCFPDPRGGGASDEAVTIARAWARKQAGKGCAWRAALATNALAELLLRNGMRRHPPRGGGSRKPGPADQPHRQLIRARRLQGQSRLGMNGRAGGLRLLNQAAVMAAAHPTAEAVLLSSSRWEMRWPSLAAGSGAHRVRSRGGAWSRA